MALHFYDYKEEFIKEDSINKYADIFQEYIKKIPSLEEALIEMHMSTNISDLKIKNLKNDISKKC